MRVRMKSLVLIAALSVLAAACSSGSKDDATPTTSARNDIAATVASYELVAGKPQRFIIGLLKGDQTAVVSFGKIHLAFAYLGTEAQATQQASVGMETEAQFVLIPGQDVDLATPGPRIVSGSEGTGVYRADDVTFDKAGFWGVQVSATIGGRVKQTQARFAVVDSNRIPAPGEPAPKTDNPIAGAADVDPRSIDSRADAKTPIPDPDLHSTTIAAALAAHRPLMVVVSTPTYCTSRFCGPITDSVERLAKQYGDRMAFVHLEVWQDFDKTSLNPAAAEWIYDADGSGDAMEPWTFVVGTDGLIKQRFDNVASDQELDDAVSRLLA